MMIIDSLLFVLVEKAILMISHIINLHVSLRFLEVAQLHCPWCVIFDSTEIDISTFVLHFLTIDVKQ